LKTEQDTGNQKHTLIPKSVALIDADAGTDTFYLFGIWSCCDWQCL